MESQVDTSVFPKDPGKDVQHVAPSATDQTESRPTSLNESAVPLEFPELAPHLRVLKPSRPSLTYERVE